MARARRLECVGGPCDGERFDVAPGEREVIVTDASLPGEPEYVYVRKRYRLPSGAHRIMLVYEPLVVD